jgi:cytochrome c biogenesis protein ResB
MHLVDDGTLLRVQNNLIQSKNIQNLHGSWWFNALMLILVVAIFLFFLSNQYTSTKYIIEAEATRKDIPFKENSLTPTCLQIQKHLFL